MTDELLTALKQARDYLEYLRKFYKGYSKFAEIPSFAMTQKHLNLAIGKAEARKDRRHD